MQHSPLKPFIQRLWPYRNWLLLSFVLALLTAIAAIGLLSLAGWFISAASFAGLTAATAAQFNYYFAGAGVRFFAYVRILGRYGERVISHEAIFRILADLRVWFFEKLIPRAPSYFFFHRTGDLLNRVIAHINALDHLYLRVIAPTGIALCVFIIVGIFLSFFNITLALIVSGLFLLTGFLVPYFAYHYGQSHGAALVETSSRFRTLFIDFNQGLAEILSFNAEARFLNNLYEKSDEGFALEKKMSLYQGISLGLMSLLSGLTLLIGVYMSVRLSLAGHLDGANIALIAFCILAAFEVLLPIPLAYQYLGKTKRAARSLLEITESKPSIHFQEKTPYQPANASIVFDDVSFGYTPDYLILKHFNLNIESGECIALVGESGRGKSTLLHLMCRFFDPTAGQISIGGVNIQDLSEADLRKHVTLISQRPHLFNKSIRENLCLANPDASDARLMDVLNIMQLAEFVNALPEGLDTYAGEGGLSFSGGQLRRFALARGLLSDAPIVLLDEPTEGLDQKTEGLMLEALYPWMKKKTILWVSHHTTNLTYADRVIKV